MDWIATSLDCDESFDETFDDAMAEVSVEEEAVRTLVASHTSSALTELESTD